MRGLRAEAAQLSPREHRLQQNAGRHPTSQHCCFAPRSTPHAPPCICPAGPTATICISDSEGACNVNTPPITPPVVIQDCSANVCFLLDGSSELSRCEPHSSLSTPPLGIYAIRSGSNLPTALFSSRSPASIALPLCPQNP